jgi:hypothetical protein
MIPPIGGGSEAAGSLGATGAPGHLGQVAAKQRPELSVGHQNRLTYSGHFLTRPDLERYTTVYDKFHMPRHTSSGGRCSPIMAYRMRHLRPGCCANHVSSSAIDQSPKSVLSLRAVGPLFALLQARIEVSIDHERC